MPQITAKNTSGDQFPLQCTNTGALCAAITTTVAVTNASSATLTSVRTARYVSAQANQFRAVIRQDTPIANNTRRWGVFTSANGAFFCLSGTTSYVVTRRDSVDTMVADGSFNGELGRTLGALGTNTQTYEIIWNETGVWFILEDTLLHKVSAVTTSWTDTMHFPVRVENYNTAEAAAASHIYCLSLSINRLGPLISEAIGKHIRGVVTGQVLKYGPGKLHRVAVNDAGSPSTYVLFDDTTNTAAAAMACASVPNTVTPTSVEYMCPFFKGLAISTVNAATDLTVVYE